MALALNKDGGPNAASLGVAQQYIQAFGKLASKTNTMLLPSDAGNPSSMIAQAMAIYKTVGGPASQNDNDTNSDDASPKGIVPGSAAGAQK